MKKFWKYLLILILLLIGLACVGVLYLFFIPNSNLFGIQYIAYNKAFYSSTYEAETVNKICLNTLNYDVRIVPSNDNNIKVSVHCFAFGFLKASNNVLSITSQEESGTLTFNVSEPHGAVVPNNSYVEVLFPNKMLDLELSNNQAHTTINSSNIKINNLTYTSNNGNFNFGMGEVNGMLNLNLGNSTFTLASGVAKSTNDVNLKLTTGKFDSSSLSLGEINILSNKRGVIHLGQCETLNEDIDMAGGSIKANKVNHISVATSDTNINIKEVGLGAVIKLTNLGKITIQKLSGNSVLMTSSGDINVGTNNSPVIAETKTGNITISSAIQAVNVTTERGTIKVDFALEAPDYSSSNTRYIVANITKGSLKCTGVDRIEAISKENGSIAVELRNVVNDNLITSKDGDIKIVVNHQVSYKLATKSTNGSVRVNLSQISEYGGYTTKDETTTYVNCTESDYAGNTLVVETVNGKLNIYDTNLN